MRATFKSLRVRKLTGKPAFLTIADSESETPRIQYLTDYDDGLPVSAAESNVFRIQPDLLSPANRIASLIRFISPGVNRAEMNSPLAFCVPSFGLPACLFIINVTQISCNHSISV